MFILLFQGIEMNSNLHLVINFSKSLMFSESEDKDDKDEEDQDENSQYDTVFEITVGDRHLPVECIKHLDIFL